MLPGSGDVADPTAVNDVYVSDFSSRALPDQQLDILAPGSWVRGPFEGTPGFAHLPWWAKGKGSLVGGNPGNFYYVGGTSMATLHVAAVAALMLEKDPNLTPALIESTMKATTIVMPSTGTQNIFDGSVWTDITWDTDCTGTTCDPAGAGLLQADAALADIP